jgi:Protein of unknown function (DUF2721)
MDIEMTARAMQYILAPVVMVSACSLILNGMQIRYSNINTRMRDMARERLNLLFKGNEQVDYSQERLHEIDAQLPGLLRHHVQVHKAMLLGYLAIALFVFNMFLIAIAYATHSSLMANLSLFFFLCATATLLTSVSINVKDFRDSHCLAQYEVKRAMSK